MTITFLGARLQRLEILLAALICVMPTAASPAQNAVLPTPGQIGEVVCASDPAQTYELYLPSSYTVTKRWPIVYFFDPGGRGRRPLDLYKQIAEAHGFIFAGSNNSRNFSGGQSAAMNAIWMDTHVRLALDDRRIYASGFSGGARVAGAMALSCPRCQVAGVVAQGAGYPGSRADSNDNLLYFFAVGNRDFNWPEVVTIRRRREERGQPYRVQVFAGSHQWAPKEVMEDAIQWLILKAMQQDSLPRDEAFIEGRFQQVQVEAERARQTHDSIAELSSLHSAAADFSGLRNVEEQAKQLGALKESVALKKALKAEQQEIDEQFSLEREILPKLRDYSAGNAADLNALRLDIMQALGGLRDRANRAKEERKRLIYSRAFDDIRIEEIENGQQELEARHFAKAETCFALIAEATDDPWPLLLLAETHAAAGNAKQAVHDLQEALRRGFKDAELLESDPLLQVLKQDAAFQKLLAGLKGR